MSHYQYPGALHLHAAPVLSILSPILHYTIDHILKTHFQMKVHILETTDSTLNRKCRVKRMKRNENEKGRQKGSPKQVCQINQGA